jgi:hypothetical protein
LLGTLLDGHPRRHPQIEKNAFVSCGCTAYSIAAYEQHLASSEDPVRDWSDRALAALAQCVLKRAQIGIQLTTIGKLLMDHLPPRTMTRVMNIALGETRFEDGFEGYRDDTDDDEDYQQQPRPYRPPVFNWQGQWPEEQQPPAAEAEAENQAPEEAMWQQTQQMEQQVLALQQAMDADAADEAEGQDQEPVQQFGNPGFE